MMTVRNIDLIYLGKGISNCTDIGIFMNTPYSMGDSILGSEVIKSIIMFGAGNDFI